LKAPALKELLRAAQRVKRPLLRLSKRRFEGLTPMTAKKERPATIADYILAAPIHTRKKLREMHACIRKSAPGATGGLKWGMPAFSYKRILVTFAAFQHHIGFYPTPSAVKAFAKDLAKFKTASGSIQFPLDRPLPLPLIRKITAFRLQESLTEDKKWRT
jgi:uncharacterized protein YdhG (YjbR/CyaY superfamily)